MADPQKTQELFVILNERFDFDFDRAMTLAQMDDNDSYLRAHGCTRKPTLGDLAMAHEQGPIQYCALLKADPAKAAQDVLAKVKGETAGKIKANVRENPLIFKNARTIADIKASADRVMGTIRKQIINVARAIAGKKPHARRHRGQSHPVSSHHPHHYRSKAKIALKSYLVHSGAQKIIAYDLQRALPLGKPALKRNNYTII